MQVMNSAKDSNSDSAVGNHLRRFDPGVILAACVAGYMRARKSSTWAA